MLHGVACPLGAEWTIEIGSSPRFGFAASQNLRSQLVHEKSTTLAIISDQKQWRGEWRMTSRDFE